jgi:capsular polysaccharide transport system ATP-binding protein
MTVRLQNVTKTVRVHGKPRVLFDGLDLEIGSHERIGVLGLPKSGKTTLLRLICGTERPDSGRIQSDSNISWPIPYADFIVPNASLGWNIRSVARFYGIKDRDFPRRVGELGGLGQFINLPLTRCPPYARQQLGFAIGIAMDFDLYLFDNQIVPPRKEFREQALEFLAERTEGKAFLLATGVAPVVAERCDTAYVLEHGRATHFSDPKEAAEYFKGLLKAEGERKKVAEGQEKPADDLTDSTSEEEERSVELVGAAVADVF